MSGFNPAVLQTKAQGTTPYNIDSVTIMRNAGGPNPVVTTVWTGVADLQETGGQTYFNPAGAVEEIGSVLIIDQNAAPVLPTVKVGDIVTNAADGKTFTVVAVSEMTFIFPYLRLELRRGGERYEQK